MGKNPTLGGTMEPRRLKSRQASPVKLLAAARQAIEYTVETTGQDRHASTNIP